MQLALRTGTAPGDWTDLQDILTAIELLREEDAGGH